MLDNTGNNQKPYVNKKNNKSDMLDKKKKLQDMFVKSTAKTSSNPIQIVKDRKSDDNKEMVELKNKNNKLIKENKSKDLKIDDLKSQIKTLKNSNDKLKEKYNKTYILMDEQNRQLDEKNTIIENKNEEIKTINEQFKIDSNRLKELERLVGIGYVHELELENKKTQEEHRKIMQRIKSLQHTYKNQYSVIYNKEEEFRTKYNAVKDTTRRRVKFYQDENFKLVNELNELKKQNELLTIQDRERVKPIKDNRTANKVKGFKDRIRKELKSLYMTITRKRYIKVNTLRGFLVLDEIKKKLAFKDTYGRVYNIRYFKEKWMKAEVDSYAIAHEDENGNVIVVHVGNNREYEKYIKNLKIEKAKKKKRDLEIQEKNKDYENKEQKEFYDYGYRILVITSMSQTKYINHLTSMGLDADGFDSYKENAKRLVSILSKYDVILYCVRHSRHYCGDILKNQNDFKKNQCKYNFIGNDSLEEVENLVNAAINDIKKKKETAIDENF